MDKLVRYGKSSQGLAGHKLAMFEDNSRLLHRNEEIAEFYRRQPLRLACKNCRGILKQLPDFISHGIGYELCQSCGHLNGAYEETAAFCDFLYTSDDGKEYAKAYSAQGRAEYQRRVQDIYLPKAEFLAEALSHHASSVGSLALADFGAGSGYFVAALLQQGFNNVQGFEVSTEQVALGNSMIPGGRLHRFAVDRTQEVLAELQADVVSLIGVLEHLLNPYDALEAISRNVHVDYLYFSVPLYSPVVAVEAAFPGVFNRHLGGAHTHLYTERSIRYFAKVHGFEVLAEWWFGLDMLDLYRSLFVTLSGSTDTRALADLLAGTLAQHVDGVQLLFDTVRSSSEVHMLLRKSAS
jgi:hypothetical protein